MYTSIYSEDIPDFMKALQSAPEMRRLADIGMHCGCEYAGLPVYRQAGGNYSRYIHSIGVARIVWHFTHDMRQTMAGLFHDIATPVFAHSIDFMNGDHMKQESTEEMTRSMIEGSSVITAVLQDNQISVDEVDDYHKYPIADNDTPMLSADRLEYTLGNGFLVHHMSLSDIAGLYHDLTIAENEYGAPELCFQTMEAARVFTELSLRNSRWYVSDEDRFAMQYLADLMKLAMGKEIITLAELYSTETCVIEKLKAHEELGPYWEAYTKLTEVASSETRLEDRYCVIVPAKKRYINPLVLIQGRPVRISEADSGLAEGINSFLEMDFDRWLFEK